jgi:flagella basal body P-ring formation protein FlgA
MVCWFLASLAAVLAIFVAAISSAPAAEIRLRAQCAAVGSVVTLGDVAEIVAADRRQAETLAAVELCPAPAAPQQRFLRNRELQDLLVLRGVNLAEHQFSGASQTTVTSSARSARPEVEKTVPLPALRQANRRMCEALLKYLQQQAAADQSWNVQIDLNDSQARLCADTGAAISLSGGKAPWTGTQHFEVTMKSARGSTRFELDARVTAPSARVVTTHAIIKGTVLRAGDVELQRDGVDESDAAAFSSVEEVLGRETTRAVPSGKVLTQDSLRAPLLVHRGDVVTVYVHSAGIRIRTTGRARDDGSQDELVAVESLLDRSTYFARVNGVREVEVYGRSARAEEPAVMATSPLVRR